MKTALWETSAGALAALLNARQPLNKADLYTLTLAGGAVYRWSGHDTAIAGNGQLWTLGPGIKRSRVRFTVGVEVDTLTLTLSDNVVTTINGQPLIPFIRAGGLNNARLQLDRVFWGVGDAAPVGALLWFTGRVSELPRVDRYAAQLTVRSDLEVLDTMVPRDVYSAGCLNTLYDAKCGADRASKTIASVASAGTDVRRITFVHSLGQPVGYFDLGVVTFTSGGNAGISRTVKTHSAATMTVLNPWPAAVAAGDAFSIVPGCDKTRSGTNGCPKFHSSANQIKRFRGQPFIPVAESIT